MEQKPPMRLQMRFYVKRRRVPLPVISISTVDSSNRRDLSIVMRLVRDALEPILARLLRLPGAHCCRNRRQAGMISEAPAVTLWLQAVPFDYLHRENSNVMVVRLMET